MSSLHRRSTADARVPRYFLVESHAKKYSKHALLIPGYRIEDVEQRILACKIFNLRGAGGAEAHAVAKHERRALRRAAAALVVKLLDVSDIKPPGCSTCSVLEMWGTSVRDLSLFADHNPTRQSLTVRGDDTPQRSEPCSLNKLTLQRQVFKIDGLVYKQAMYVCS